MKNEPRELTDAAIELLGIDTQFEGMMDQLLGYLRQSMGVPENTSDPIVDLEFRRARVRLEGFREEYLSLYASALRMHIASEELASVIEGLSPVSYTHLRAHET